MFHGLRIFKHGNASQHSNVTFRCCILLLHTSYINDSACNNTTYVRNKRTFQHVCTTSNICPCGERGRIQDGMVKLCEPDTGDTGVITMDTEILITLITLLGSVAVQLGGILVNNKLISYRIEQLEEKVKKHNDLIERVYKLEEANAVQDNRLAVTDHRLSDLESKVG